MRFIPRVIRLRVAQAILGLWAWWSYQKAARAVILGRGGVWDEQSKISTGWRMRRWSESEETHDQVRKVGQFFELE